MAQSSMTEAEGPHPPPIRCLGTGEYVPWGWQRWPCSECRAMVWRDPDTLGLVEHSPGDAGQPPEESV